MKDTLRGRIEFCRGSADIFGKPNLFQVNLNCAEYDAEKKYKDIKNSNIKELLILTKMSYEAERFMFETWAELDGKESEGQDG